MLVDAGLAFPSDGMHGVNVVMPDTTFLRDLLMIHLDLKVIRQLYDLYLLEDYMK